MISHIKIQTSSSSVYLGSFKLWYERVKYVVMGEKFLYGNIRGN